MKPNLHLEWWTFEESQGNYVKAAEIPENMDQVNTKMLQIAYRRINLERRRGDLDKACSLYEQYIESSKNKTISNNISVKYARFLCKIKNDLDKAIEILIKVINLKIPTHANKILNFFLQLSGHRKGQRQSETIPPAD